MAEVGDRGLGGVLGVVVLVDPGDTLVAPDKRRFFFMNVLELVSKLSIKPVLSCISLLSTNTTVIYPIKKCYQIIYTDIVYEYSPETIESITGTNV